MHSIPPYLVSEILAGNCVAFVGAGFSAAARLPRWGELLTSLANGDVAPEIREHIAMLVVKGTAHALDEAAQVLEETIGRPGFVGRLRELLDARDPGETMGRRLAWLKGIPFRAILTTNFDPILVGELPSASSYRRVLRPGRFRWWEEAFWGQGEGPFVMKLHGAVELPDPDRQVVLTRRDYRRRLYEDPAYTTFLRAVFASHTVLYLGFSFTDAYLNELRSEVLSLLGHDGQADPVAYAVACDVPALTAEHFLRTEGVQLLSYGTSGGSDHSGFDRILNDIWDCTNPAPRFARMLEGRRILWVDPAVDNNEAGLRFLEHAATASGRGHCRIEFAASPDAGLDALAVAAEEQQAFDLVITRWGGRERSALSLLQGLRERGLHCPVLVFASDFEAEARKRQALAAGALAYCFRWESLFREIERVFESAFMTG